MPYMTMIADGPRLERSTQQTGTVVCNPAVPCQSLVMPSNSDSRETVCSVKGYPE